MRQSIYTTTCVCLILAISITARAQKPEVVVQTGHSRSIDSFAFSPNGKTLASGSADGTIKLWDISTGTGLRTLTGVDSFGDHVTFSPDGKTLASAGISGVIEGRRSGAIKLWDVVTGTELRNFNPGSPNVNTIAFSPDGKILASVNEDDRFRLEDVPIGTIKLWDVSTGVELRTVTVYGVRSIAFSPDGKTLAGGSSDGTIKLWDVSTGMDSHTFKERLGLITTVAFSPDGKILASGGSDSDYTPGKPTTTGKIRLWDVLSGTELRTLTLQYFSMQPIAFSPDGKQIAMCSHTVVVWDVFTGRELRTLAGIGYSATFSPDWKILAGSEGSALTLWDVSTGRVLLGSAWYFPPIYSIAISPDGKTLAIGVGGGIDGMSGAIRLWDFSRGAMLRSIDTSGSAASLAFSPDGKILAIGTDEWYSQIALWNVSRDTLVHTYQPSDSMDSPRSLALSPDGKTIATGTFNKTIKLLDFLTLTELRTLTGQSDTVTSVTFSPDGKTLASGSMDGTISVWDVSTGTELRTFKEHPHSVMSMAFSPDGMTLASGSLDNTVRLVDVALGKEFHVFSGFSGPFAFSPDGKILAGRSSEGPIKLSEVSTGTVVQTLGRNSANATRIVFNTQSNYLISGHDDSSIKIWDAASGKELASLIAFGYQDWIVVTPDGLFDGISGKWDQILWRFNNNTFDHSPVESFFSEYYHPGLLADILAGKHPKAPADIAKKDRRQPQLKLTLADAQHDATFTARDATVKIEVLQAPAGAKDIRLFRNGSLVKSWRGDALKGRNGVTLEATIPIVAGENRLTAYAFNRDNIKSRDATLVINGADSLKRNGTLYVLTVGVGQYANPNFYLSYTPADAQAFGDEISRQQDLLRLAKLSAYQHVKVISLLNQEATKANILLSLRRLSGAGGGKLPESAPSALAGFQPSQPEDDVIFYFSGHGTAQKDRFYLIPYDIGYMGTRKKINGNGVQTILMHSISDIELEEVFSGIDAAHLLLVIDACNSGQALDAEEKRRGPMNTKGLAQLAYEKGMYILTASQSIELAYESEALKHSYMTYALIEEGLKSKVKEADANGDGQVWLREWFDYVVQRVPRMREEKIEQTAKQQGKSLDLVEIMERGKMQTPRVFYRREPDARPWIVARIK